MIFRMPSRWYTMKAMHKLNQRGIVSIVVTLIVLLVITLITIGFATITRREQRQSLDKQLSSQAFYAAESGVNDATRALRANLFPAAPNPGSLPKTNCDPTNYTPPLNTFTIDSGNKVEISCLLINEQPSQLEFSPVTSLKSIYTPLKSAGGPMDKITIEWSPVGGGTNFNTSYPTFPVAWPASVGVLRIALTDMSGAIDHDSLINKTSVLYLYPQNGSPAPVQTNLSLPPANAQSQGQIDAVKCSTGNAAPDKFCIANINVPARAYYYLRLTSIYQSSHVIVKAQSGVTPLDFIGGQAVIDSTGKAQDVLRRVQVRIPLSTQYDFPEFAIESASPICKMLDVAPGYYKNRSSLGSFCDP